MDFFQTLQHDRAQEIKETCEISKKNNGSNGKFWPKCGPKLCKFLSQDML